MMIKYPNLKELVDIINNLTEKTFYGEESKFYYYNDKIYFEIEYMFKCFDEITIYFDWSIFDMFKDQIKYTEFDVFICNLLSNLKDWKNLDKCKYAGKALHMFQIKLEENEKYYT